MSEVREASRALADLDLDPIRMFLAGRSGGSDFRLYRSRSLSYWLLPAGTAGRIAAEYLYSPQKLAGACLRVAMQCGVLASGTVRVSDDTLSDLKLRIAREAALQDGDLAFSIGPPRPGNKAVLSLIRDGRPLAFAKVASSVGAKELLAAEAESLDRLAGIPEIAGRVPRKLACFDWRGSEILVVSPGPRSRGPKRGGKLQAEFLGDLHAATVVAREFRACPARGAIASASAGEAGLPTGEDRDRYGRVLRVLDGAFGRDLLPTSLAHGDFAAWNTRRGREGLWVFDWETMFPSGLPMHDAIHFGFAPAALMDRRERVRLADLLIERVWPAGRDLLPYLRLAYLADVSISTARRLGGESQSRKNPILSRARREIDAQLEAVGK